MQYFAKECLFDALMILMDHKDFEAISITELCKKAGVSRTTFYRNYNDIKDILAEHFKNTNFGLDFPDRVDDFDLKKYIPQYFDFCLKNKRFLDNIIKAKLSYVILDSMDNYCKGPFKEYLDFFGFNIKYEISAFIGLWYKMSVDWIEDGMPDPEGSITLTYNLLTALVKSNFTAS